MHLITRFAGATPGRMFSRFALSFVATAAAAASGLPPAPPWFRDRQYVANGCYISATAYLVNLRQHYPDVKGRTENVLLPSGKPHTVAVIQWGERLFLRDMFIAVVEIQGNVQHSFECALRSWNEEGGPDYYPERRPRSPEQRQKEVELAATLLRFAKPQVTHIPSSIGPVKVLWWKTSEGDLAVYEPSVGTAVGPSNVLVSDVVIHVLRPLIEAVR
jgi:hypothetical protein